MSIISWPLDKWLDNVALGALSSKETLLSTFDIASTVIQRGIPGDFVECGVFGGSQCAAMARAIMEYNFRCVASGRSQDIVQRRVHLFDSFNGIPQAGPKDKTFGESWKEPVAVCVIDAVKAHMEEWGIPNELLVYHPGLFSETFRWFLGQPNPLPEQIALLRIDCDLYESTSVCLEYLYPLLSPGGWLIIDDYGLDGCRAAVEEYFKGNYPPVYWQRPR